MSHIPAPALHPSATHLRHMLVHSSKSAPDSHDPTRRMAEQIIDKDSLDAFSQKQQRRVATSGRAVQSPKYKRSRSTSSTSPRPSAAETSDRSNRLPTR